jgi:hypothetical protein
VDTELSLYSISISCHSKPYKLAFELNKALECNLEMVPQFEFPNLSSDEGFPYYRWDDPSEHYTYHLFGNRGFETLIFPKLSHLDFFFLITGFYEELDLSTILSKIKAASGVLAAVPVKLAPDGKHKFIFE